MKRALMFSAFRKFRSARLKGREGFTLIELLIVIVIIGILAAIGTTVYFSQSSKARDAASRASIKLTSDAINGGIADGQLTFEDGSGATVTPDPTTGSVTGALMVSNTGGKTLIKTGTTIYQTRSDWCVSDGTWASLNGILSQTTGSCTSPTIIGAGGGSGGAPVFTLFDASETDYMDINGGQGAGTSINADSVANAGGTGTFTISPTLSNGLTFDQYGDFNATPLTAQASTIYTITETDPSNGLSSTQSFTYTVLANAPAISIPNWVSAVSGSSQTYIQMGRIASNSNGTRLAMIGDGSTVPNPISAADAGTVYTSINSGTTWAAHVLSTQAVNALTSSSDGVHLVAVGISSSSVPTAYTSSDSGATWTSSATPVNSSSGLAGQFTSLASSSDGSKLIAGDMWGGLFLSTDSGASWTQQSVLAPGGHWSVAGGGVTSSSSGQYISAVDNYGVATSTNFGATWNFTTPVVSGTPSSISSSSDGSKLVLSTHQGAMYRSIDFGATWTVLTVPASTFWTTVVISPDGAKIAALDEGCSSCSAPPYSLYLSLDSGVTWNSQYAPGTFKSYNWTALGTYPFFTQNGLKLGMGAGDLWWYTGTGL